MSDLIKRDDALTAVGEAIFDGRSWYDALVYVPSANTCENASEITRKTNATDLISREDAIELFEEYSYPIEHDMGSVERGMTLYGIKLVLDEVPSAERTGKWISYIDFDGYVECPFCESATNCESTEEAETLHYCFNCGARLEGVKE